MYLLFLLLLVIGGICAWTLEEFAWKFVILCNVFTAIGFFPASGGILGNMQVLDGEGMKIWTSVIMNLACILFRILPRKVVETTKIPVKVVRKKRRYSS